MTLRAAEAARDEVRVFLIFCDEYHIERLAAAIQGRRALTDFVARRSARPISWR
jgi:hypothetical protein